MKKKTNYNKLVRDKRIEKGLTQDDVANKMIVSRQTVSNWEKDGYNIHKDDLDKLSEYLDFKIPTKKCKYIILSLITLFFVILFILLILNIKKNKIAIYKGNIDYQMTNTIFIETNSNYFLYLGSFINEDYDINIKLYYKSKNKNKILYEGNYSENLSFTEEKGYEEYFDKNFDINNLYIDITDKDITKTYKFNFIKENNQFHIFKTKRISDDKNNFKEETINEEEITQRLLDNGFIKTKDGFEKKTKEGTFYYDIVTNSCLYTFNYGFIDYDLKVNNIFVNISLVKNNTYDIQYIYNIENKKMDCLKGDCDKYKNYIEFMENSVKNFTQK